MRDKQKKIKMEECENEQGNKREAGIVRGRARGQGKGE